MPRKKKPVQIQLSFDLTFDEGIDPSRLADEVAECLADMGQRVAKDLGISECGVRQATIIELFRIIIHDGHPECAGHLLLMLRNYFNKHAPAGMEVVEIDAPTVDKSKLH